MRSQVTLRFVRGEFNLFADRRVNGTYDASLAEMDKVYLPFMPISIFSAQVSMLMFGVSYHILPRFSGKQLYSDMLVNLHF